MSRSNNTDLKNPATKFIEWSGSKGTFKHYDKETESNIENKLPFRFLILDCLSCIRGYSDADQSGFWSNEVRSTKTDELVVRTKKGICFKGLYENLAGARDCTGTKYCQSVYVAIQDGKEYKIACLQFTGAALGAWIDFRKKNKVYDGAVEVAEMIEGKKGATVYQIPVFKMITTKPETDELAKKLDTELQEYFTLYFDKSKHEEIAPENLPEKEVADPLDNFTETGEEKNEPLPF
jgi:hypothetical protein